MDVVSEATDIVELEKDLKEIEISGRDDVLQEEVLRELDRVQEEGTAKSSLERARRFQ